MKKNELRVVEVQIRDVLGAREFVVEPGQITVLRGRNGSGKSTALAAVQAALGGGNLARLARVDPDGEATEPEVVLVLEGEGSETYRVERKGEKVRVRARVGDTAAFEDVGKPQSWLRSLYDPQGANPVAFLTAPDKDRALMLLQALDLKYDRAELLAVMGLDDAEGAPLVKLPTLPPGLHPLEEVAIIREAAFDARTGVNRDEKAKRSAAEQTRLNAPAVIPGDPSAEVEKLEAQARGLAAEIAQQEEAAKAFYTTALQQSQAEHDSEEQTIAAEFRVWASKRRGAHEQKVAEIRAEAERRIADLTAELEVEVGGRRTKDELAMAELDQIEASRLAAAEDSRGRALEQTKVQRENLQQKLEQLGTLRAQADASKKAVALHGQAKQFDEEADELKAESERLTAAIEALDAFRRRMAEDLPIEGLSIEGKEIRVHGVLFEQLNAAQRAEIAVQVACLRAKGSRLPVVFVDGAEMLDSEHFGALVSELKRRGMQAFVAKVTDDPLTVTTEQVPARVGAE